MIENEFQKEITIIYTTYVEKFIEIHNFRIFSNFTTIMVEVMKPEILKSFFESLDSKNLTYDGFIDIKTKLKNQNRTLEVINLELVYKLYVQIFEEFLSEIIYCCLLHFPKFMDIVDSKNEIPLYKIFDESASIEEIKDFMITFRVKKIIQSNNIVESISKLEKLLNCKFKLEEKALNMLFISSLNRNLLTHNNGIVNDIYINQLKQRKLTINFSKNHNITSSLSIDLNNETNNQTNIAKKIYETIISESGRLKKHHSNMI